jgi:hypothetical protein
MKNFFLSIFMCLGVATVFQNCAPVEFTTMKPVTTNGNPIVDPCDCEVECFQENWTQRTNQAVDKLDILFVTDTSGSLDEERSAVAEGIVNFVGQLSPNIDYNIGVMLAHAQTSYAGRLYQTSANEGLVLKKSALSLTEIKNRLKTKLTNIVTESATDGGEVGTYSLNKSLQTGYKENIINAGMYRADAALAVVFISDENDICAIYPNGVTPVTDTENIEPTAKSTYCSGITAAGVYNSLKALKGNLPLSVNGVIYTGNVPAVGENEIGYGYKDMITLNNGVAVDMNQTSPGISNGLGAIGTQVQGTINYQTEFQLHNSGVDASTIKVYVNGNLVTHTYTAGTNSVHIQLSDCVPGSAIVIKYCLEEQDTSF